MTVFSAPNYCYRCGNKAAIVDIDENMNHKIIQFDHAPPKGAGITEVSRSGESSLHEHVVANALPPVGQAERARLLFVNLWRGGFVQGFLKFIPTGISLI